MARNSWRTRFGGVSPDKLFLTSGRSGGNPATPPDLAGRLTGSTAITTANEERGVRSWGTAVGYDRHPGGGVGLLYPFTATPYVEVAKHGDRQR